MAYQWERGEGVADGFRRIVDEEIAGAIDSLTNPEARGIEASIHDARKRCKKVRGVARVVRPGLSKDSYEELNQGARAVAGRLAPFRDAHAVLKTFDGLLTNSDGPIPTGGVFAVRAELSRRSQEASDAVASQAEAVQDALSGLAALREVAAESKVDDEVDVAVAGVKRTYGRGRDAIEQAWQTLDDEDLHGWRKREKDLWYAARLLGVWAPAILEPFAELLHVLSEDLGDDHDLAVLTALLREEVDAFGGDAAVDAAMTLVTPTRTALQDHAFGLGAQVYVEKPGAFGRRLRAYWRTWHHLDRDLPAGGA
jgi:CHAD domain-containing protein